MGAVLEMKSVILFLAAVLCTACQPSLLPGDNRQKAPQTTARSADAPTGPRLQVQIASRGATALVSRVAVNNDVETWRSVDNISLSFRDGVLVASRGLGFDLMAADPQGTITAFAGQTDGVYRRQMRYLTGEHHSAYLTAGCSMTTTGIESVDGISLVRSEERCQAGRHVFTNIFWRDQSNHVRRSTQWLSPEIGYISTSLHK